MAQILTISEKIQKPGVNEVGDVYAVLPDEHKFSPTEIEKFDIPKIPSLTVEDFKQCVYSNKPEVKTVWDCAVKGYTDVHPVEAEVWKDDGVWKLIIKSHHQRPNISSLTQVDFDALASSDTPKATALLILEAMTFYFVSAVENQTEITLGD